MAEHEGCVGFRCGEETYLSETKSHTDVTSIARVVVWAIRLAEADREDAAGTAGLNVGNLRAWPIEDNRRHHSQTVDMGQFSTIPHRILK